MSSRTTVFLAVAAMSGAFAAENAPQLQVPVLGWVSAGEPAVVRAVVGVPGAVVLGEPIALPDGLGRIAIAPAQSIGIAERIGGSEAGMVRLSRTAAPEVIPISGSMARFDRAVFSSSGKTAVLYSSSAGRLQVISGIPGQAELRYSAEVSGSLDAPVTALAVRDDGQVAVGTSDGERGSVWLISSSESPRRAGAAAVPSALAFQSDTGALLVGDKGSRQVSLLGSEYKLIAGEGQGIVAPSDMQASGNTLWVADSGASALLRLDMASGNLITSASSYAPVSLLRTEGNAVFLVGSADGNTTGIWTPESKNTELWRLPLSGRVE